MSKKNQSQATQLSFTMQAVLLLLVVMIGMQIWYMLALKKQLDAIQTEFVLIEPSVQQAIKQQVGEQQVVEQQVGEQQAIDQQADAVATNNSPVFAENRTVAVREDQAVQKISPEKRNPEPAIPPALASPSPFNAPNYAQTRDPYEDLRRRQRYLERAFNNRQNSYKRPDFQYHVRQDLSVPEMDVKEENRQYIVRVNIPGADARNLSVKLEGQRLTVRGKQMHQKQGSDASGRITFSERRSGSFRRSITLHAAVEEKGMKTRIDNGVLMIIIPKKK